MLQIPRYRCPRQNTVPYRARARAAPFGRGVIQLALLALVVLLASTVHAQQSPPATASSPAKLDKNKLSYAIGYQIGSQFTGDQPSIDFSTLQRGMADAYAKRHPRVPMAQMHAQLDALERHMHASARSEFSRIASQNKRKSAQFMVSHRKQPGVIELPSGIQYQMLERGDGKVTPLVSSKVTINYRGMLPDGTEFDSTWAHGAPVTFTVSGVIPGWRDVIPRMHVGDRWKVVIPPRLAYGKQGALPRIGPNEALVFDIELLEIVQR